MSRTIKSRAKRLDNGAWETGSAVVVRQGLRDEQWFIADKMTGYLTPVSGNTVGRFTGLHDANGKEIYEDDILREGYTGYTFQVVYDAPEFCFKTNSYGYRFLNRAENFEIVGNIYDNPELLKGGRNGSH